MSATADGRECDMRMDPSISNLRRTGKPRGFTILELMVVIGIITILIGILLPAVRGVQRAAKNATTTNLINTIASAIDQYQSVQRDWPGAYEIDDRLPNANWTPIRNSDGTSTSGNLTDKLSSADLNITRGEELLLCLVGGLNIQWQANVTPFKVTPASYVYNAEDLDRGHVSLSPRNRGRLKPFMPAGGGSRSDTKATSAQYRQDTLVPEFVDTYGTPMLYVRAKKGVVSTQAYYYYAVDTQAVIDVTSPLYLEAQRYVEDAMILFPPSYLQSDTLPGQTRQQDRYVLISAGADKKFGTADDITNFGAPLVKR